MAYDRSGGRLGEDIILSMYFQQNGVGADVYDIQQVEIYNPYGVLVVFIKYNGQFQLDKMKAHGQMFGRTLS
jgi:hypothetical protein